MVIRVSLQYGQCLVDADGQRLVGIISDGDLRRFFEKQGDRALSLTAADCMSPKPVTIGRQELATRALNLMEARKITSLMVVDAEGRLEGVLHLHDLWTTEMI